VCIEAVVSPFSDVAGFGGADRDRTDDLKLAKLPLSQLSYGPRRPSHAEIGKQKSEVRRPMQPFLISAF
jgi:hypothetical protein